MQTFTFSSTASSGTNVSVYLPSKDANVSSWVITSISVGNIVAPLTSATAQVSIGPAQAGGTGTIYLLTGAPAATGHGYQWVFPYGLKAFTAGNPQYCTITLQYLKNDGTALTLTQLTSLVVTAYPNTV